MAEIGRIDFKVNVDGNQAVSKLRELDAEVNKLASDASKTENLNIKVNSSSTDRMSKDTDSLKKSLSSLKTEAGGTKAALADAMGLSALSLSAKASSMSFDELAAAVSEAISPEDAKRFEEFDYYLGGLQDNLAAGTISQEQFDSQYKKLCKTFKTSDLMVDMAYEGVKGIGEGAKSSANAIENMAKTFNGFMHLKIVEYLIKIAKALYEAQKEFNELANSARKSGVEMAKLRFYKNLKIDVKEAIEVEKKFGSLTEKQIKLYNEYAKGTAQSLSGVMIPIKETARTLNTDIEHSQDLLDRVFRATGASFEETSGIIKDNIKTITELGWNENEVFTALVTSIMSGETDFSKEGLFSDENISQIFKNIKAADLYKTTFGKLKFGETAEGGIPFYIDTDDFDKVEEEFNEFLDGLSEDAKDKPVNIGFRVSLDSSAQSEVMQRLYETYYGREAFSFIKTKPEPLKPEPPSSETKTKSLAEQFEDQWKNMSKLEKAIYLYDQLAESIKSIGDAFTEAARNRADYEKYLIDKNLEDIQNALDEEDELRQSRYDSQLEDLEESYERGRMTEEEYNAQKQARRQEDLAEQKRIEQERKKAEEDAAKKKNEIDEKQFNAEKANSLTQVAIDLAKGIMQIMATYAAVPWMQAVLIPAVTLAAGVQAHTIASQKYIPSYDKGTDYVPFDQLAQIHQGEAVLTKAEAERYRSGNLPYQNRQTPVIIYNNMTGNIEADGLNIARITLQNWEEAKRLTI